ncbi:OPT family oligopeptide transporter [Thermoactinomyces sp. DSM 45892]|uniref:OPT family oligopeptide transporter n=1 Tax=Thermoactinomyces sp. DSM 45892 TaxID=1882753 RepID=UPI00089A70B0|nr:oligopeptide transporter, OPT family [Thermoactinomyces sp. DSM 45892]SDZ37025.1 putative oligopeptide transporter, OPT family [Thermoactinomyces sp. DSM 45892]
MKRESKFVPYIPASRSLPEITIVSVILGVVLAIVFGAANAYLGLKIGLTVTASIPAAVISMAILRGIFRRESILENNIVQTMTTAGEAVAAGAIFTIPALYLMKLTPSQGMVAFIALTGGFLGVFMMIPLRRLLIVNEHETLPYPEGTACAEVLKSGEQGGSSAALIFAGFAIGGLVKVFDGLRWIKNSVGTAIAGYKGATVGMDVMPSLLGVGYIIGPRIAGQMMAGGLFASVVFIPMISFFTTGSPTSFFPAIEPISTIDAGGIYSNYIRYIGAGAVATGGLITLLKTLPLLIKSVRDTIVSLRTQDQQGTLERTDQDLSYKYIGIGVLVLILIIAFTPVTNVGVLGAIAIAIFGFLFVAVASRIVGIVGSSSMPVSGMTIATLLIVTILYKATGFSGTEGSVAALVVAAIVCVAIAVAGDISQDLKTGYLVGGTPWKQQIAMMIGVLASGLLIGYVLTLFDSTYGLGGTELPAVKAVLMRIIVEGIMGGNLPWDLIFMGIGLAITIEFLGLNSLTVAVGFYLPLSISSPIMVGGIIRWLSEAFAKDEKIRRRREEVGTLFASGLIAGEALISVVIALLIVPKVIDPDKPIAFDNNWMPITVFALLAISLLWAATRFSSKEKPTT